MTSAINFSLKNQTPGGGLDKFIAIVIAFSRLSLRDNGILHNLYDGQMFRDNEKLVTSGGPYDAAKMQEGNELVLRGDDETDPFKLKFGEVISHEPSLAGRATAVLHAESMRWKDTPLAVKISWPGSERVAEYKFLAKAVETANGSRDDEWALNHLPQVLFSQDVPPGLDSIHERVESILEDNEFVNPKCEFVYERRTLRIIIQERLDPLDTLTDVREIAQVLLDVACSKCFRFPCWVRWTQGISVHRWLYERAGILHRDFSLSNIMCRTIMEENEDGIFEERVCGVLTDFDLASWKEDLDGDYKPTSQQRTGTPPFMAQGLLDGSEALHLYRHDLESLFYIMLIVATHYEIELPREGKGGGLRARRGFKELPYQDWFNQESYKTLARFKRDFFSTWQDLNLSPSFKDFGAWLEDFRMSFRLGLRSSETHKDEVKVLQRQNDGSEDKVTPKFDDETLGGHVHFSALIDPVRRLKGKLKGLIIRYDPPLRTSAGPVKTDH